MVKNLLVSFDKKMDRKLISFAILTHNRKEELERCLESILKQSYRPIEIVVVDNNSNDRTEEIFKDTYRESYLHYIKLQENIGVAGGKNAAMANSSGDIIINIDDDAWIVEEDSIEKIIEKFDSDEKIGLLTFKIINYPSLKMLTKEFPHKDNTLDSNKEFETTYFIGAGYATKKEIYDEIGPYMQTFYGMEELDLSYRLIDAGYKIIYFPEVEILHERSSKGRLPNEWEHVLENRIKTLYRNLPLRYFFINISFWSGFILVKTGNPLILLRAIRNFLRDFEKIKHQRKVLNQKTIKRIKKLGGRLYY